MVIKIIGKIFFAVFPSTKYFITGDIFCKIERANNEIIVCHLQLFFVPSKLPLALFIT